MDTVTVRPHISPIGISLRSRWRNCSKNLFKKAQQARFAGSFWIFVAWSYSRCGLEQDSSARSHILCGTGKVHGWRIPVQSSRYLHFFQRRSSSVIVSAEICGLDTEESQRSCQIWKLSSQLKNNSFVESSSSVCTIGFSTTDVRIVKDKVFLQIIFLK